MRKREGKKRIKGLFVKTVFAVLLFLITFFPSLSFAGTLSLSPSSGTHREGENFTVNLEVDSTIPVNTAGATLEFDRNLLRVNNISRDNSIFTMWPEEPTYSNTTGTISFGGGSPGGEFQGTGGRIISINFRVVGKGTADVSFSSGQLLYAGEDRLSSLSGGTYTLEEAQPEPDPTPDPTPPPQPTPTPDPEGPDAPQITSQTHPEEGEWYSEKEAVFSWEVPSGVDAIRLDVSQEEGTPGEVHEPPIEEKVVEELEEGTWYFLLQFREGGQWGEVASYQFGVDLTSPEPFRISIDNEEDPTNPRPVFHFSTEDQLSGIRNYEIVLNNELYDTVTPEEIEEGYTPSPLSPGNYYLQIEAFDMAGNSVSDATLFSIEPLLLEIEEFPEEIEQGEELSIRGRTVSGAEVTLYIEGGQEIREESLMADNQGDFNFRITLSGGEYLVWLEAEDERGALSGEMEKIALVVTPDRLILLISLALGLLILIGLIIILLLRRQIVKERKEESKENKNTIEVKREAYEILEKRIKDQIKELEEKVDLSRSESHLLKELKETLEVTQKARVEEEE